MLVRPARAAELAEAGAVVLRAYAADGHLEAADAAHATGYAAVVADAAARARDAEVLVAVDDAGDGGATVLGCVTFALPGSPWAELSRGEEEAEFRMLGVDPAARGRGVGEALVAACVERTRALGRRRLVICSMDTMTTAHRLYGRLGFVRRPELDWEPEPGVRLVGLSLEV